MPRPACDARGSLLKISLVVPSYRTPFGGNGGVAEVTDFLARQLLPLGTVQVVSLCMSRRAPQSRSVVRPSTWCRGAQLSTRDEPGPGGAPVLDVGAPLAELEWARFLPRAAFTQAVQDSDVLVVVSGSPAAAVVTRRSSKPVVLQVATLARLERDRLIRTAARRRRPALRLAAWGTDLLDSQGLRAADIVCVENLHMQAIAAAASAAEVVLCPPGIDTGRFKPAQDRRVPGRVVAVGRLSDPRKDFPTLLRAARRCLDNGEHLEVVIAGRGDPRPGDLALAELLGLRDVIRFESDVSADDLVRLLQSASLFVSSSAEEGLGISILEAMAAGAPVVATRTDGALFVLGAAQAPVGIHVPVGDDVALGEAIARVLGDRATADDLRQRGLRRVQTEFDLDTTGERFRNAVHRVAWSEK